MSGENRSIIAVNIEEAVSSTIADILKVTTVTPLTMNMNELVAEPDVSPCLIMTGPIKEMRTEELAQSLRMQYPSIPIFFVCVSRAGFERKDFIKNGFTDAFLMPIDTNNLRTAISEILAKESNGTVRVFRPVKIIDVEPGTTLDFDTSVYLPSNKKYVRLSNAGDSLDSGKIEKIKKAKYNSIYVPAEQMPKFYQYSAKRLKDLGAESFSATERREKLQTAVRDLVSGLFTEQTASFESGQAILKDCGEIVKSYIMQGADGEWFTRIQSVLGERGDTYSHTGNVSTLAALFSMGLGIGKPEDLALAGLLHDIGTAELPADIQALEPEDMTSQQHDQYKRHPEMSINLIKSRKIIVPEIVSKAILQHHELYNGTGYPNGFFGDRICKEAQVLALADRFDYLTRLKVGKPPMTPSQAVEKIRQEQLNDPSKIHYNPDLLKNLLTLFPSG